MSMDHPEGLGSASASEVPARPPGSGYNFRPRSRSATAPKNRRLGSVELQGVGSTLDLPAITPPISPTPSGAGNPTHENIPTIISHDSATQPRAYNSTLIPDTVVVGPSSPFSTHIIIIIIIITSVNKAGVMWSFSVILSFVLYHSVNRITDERGNGRRPNLAGPGKRWPSRSGWLLVVIRICTWIPVFHFLHHWELGDFPTFVSISLFSQFSCNQQPIWTKLGEMNDADECIHDFGTDIRRTSGSRLIRKSEFESESILFQILASAEVCTLYYRQNIFN